jgi:hypothetical protein
MELQILYKCEILTLYDGICKEKVLFLLRALCVSSYKVRNLRPKIIHFETGRIRNKRFSFGASKKRRTVKKRRQKTAAIGIEKQKQYKAYNRRI